VTGGFTAAVAEQVTAVRADRLPPEVAERTRHVLLDWLGVTIAGSAEPSARIAQRVAAGEGGAPLASVLGTGLRTGPQQAALANGVAAHALDYDDGNRWAGAHPSAPVVSAVLALAESRDASGAQAAEAVVAGIQALCLIGYANGPSHYAKGFHTTGTIGALGAAAGCARLLGLDAGATARALSLAATQAAGLKAVFGTMGKHLNAGRAAANGLLAAQLAAEGFTAPPDTLEAPQGFAATQSTSFDPGRRLEGGRYGIERVLFKRYACCADAHSAIEGVRAILARRPAGPDQVASVRLRVSSGLLDVCAIPVPRNGTEGKFSAPYAAALALTGATAGPADFTDNAVRQPQLLSLLRRIELEAGWEGHASDPIEVTLRFTDGTSDTATVNPLVPVPDAELPAQWASLVAKFAALAEPVVGPEGAAGLLDGVTGVMKFGSAADLLAAARADLARANPAPARADLT
jgi:2-methylcitrate dehydratase PrpD